MRWPLIRSPTSCEGFRQRVRSADSLHLVEQLAHQPNETAESVHSATPIRSAISERHNRAIATRTALMH